MLIGKHGAVVTISCAIDVEGEEPRISRPRYEFAAVPRVGEYVALHWDDDQYPKYIVQRVIHVPAAVEDTQSYVALLVKKASI